MNKIQYIILLLALAACEPKVDVRGYQASDDWKKGLLVGQTTKEQVEAQLGSPSARSTFGAEVWYYVSSRKETVAFLAPELAEQNVLKIEFDNAGMVSDVKTYDKQDGQEFDMVKRTTPTEGHTLGFFEQILGNVGRFNNPGGTGSRSGSLPGR